MFFYFNIPNARSEKGKKLFDDPGFSQLFFETLSTKDYCNLLKFVPNSP